MPNRHRSEPHGLPGRTPRRPWLPTPGFPNAALPHLSTVLPARPHPHLTPSFVRTPSPSPTSSPSQSFILIPSHPHPHPSSEADTLQLSKGLIHSATGDSSRQKQKVRKSGHEVFYVPLRNQVRPGKTTRALFSSISKAQENPFYCSPEFCVMSLWAGTVSAWVQPQMQRLVCRWPILGCDLGATAGKKGNARTESPVGATRTPVGTL